jgi:hypothetical protein
VVDSRSREGGVWRRRKCAKGHKLHTLESIYHETRKWEVRPKIEKPKPKREKPKPKPKPDPKPIPPKDWELVVTEKSPLWLRSLAMRLDR